MSDHLLQGAKAFEILQKQFRRNIELHLLGRCNPGDGRSTEKCVEIASQVLTDCFAASPSLLEKWHGDDNLEAFLKTVALNRLKTWWKSRDYGTDVNTDSPAMTMAVDRTSAPNTDPAELRMATEALIRGVVAAELECPEGLVFMRLKGLHGVGQSLLSSIWGHHEAQTSRRIKEAMNMVRETASRHLEQSGLGIQMDTLQSALEGNPSILLGEEGDPLDDESIDLIIGLAQPGHHSDHLVRAIKLMCRNARAVELFAQSIKRNSLADDEPVVIKDPALAGVSARLKECVIRTIDHMQPAATRALFSTLMADVFLNALRSIEAEGGSLWLLSPYERMLEAVFNPMEPEIVGKRQPLASGIISLVLATCESVLVKNAGDEISHSPAVDAALGKRTGSMIAVPFCLAGSVRGVLTAVRFSPSSFRRDQLAIMERQAELLSLLLTERIHSRIME